MNELIDVYKKMSENGALFSKYTSISKEGYGCMFSGIINTNYRAILAHTNSGRYGYGGFAQGFSILEDVEGQDRSEWLNNRANNAGQEIEKHHTVHQRKAFFFQVKNNAYHITQRGNVFKRMLLDNSLSSLEKRLLCYLLILPASFDDTKNYIFAKTQEVFSTLAQQGVSAAVVLKSIKEVVDWDNTADAKNKEDLFNYDFVYYDSFFVNSIDFLTLFTNASFEERKEFKDYIVSTTSSLKDYNAVQHHILSKKYVSGGVYTKSSLIEDAWFLYVTYALANAENVSSFEQFIDVVLASYNELFRNNDEELLKTSDSSLRKFIFDTNGNRSVFQIIFCELYNIRVPLKDVAKDLTPEEIEKYSTTDPTDEIGYAQREKVVSVLKKLAKQYAEHKCECEINEDCRYFTAKENGQHYLEIHHFIPREFANDFDTSIEILENYIALCPNCHRKIHLAVDGERKHLITLLFNQRKSKLNAANLNVDLKKMFEYYKVDDKA